jgi:transposase
MVKNSTAFVGLDLGDKRSNVFILDQEGEPIEETRIPTTEPAFRRKFASLPLCRVAMEAGTHSRWASRLLEQLGHEVLVANPRRLRLIYENSRKADEADAEHLARLARLDPQLLSPIRHRGPEAQAHLTVIRSRDSLVRARTLLINHVRGSAKSTGARLRACSADSFHHRVAPTIPMELAPALLPVLETIASLTAQIHAYNRQIEQLCQEQYAETQGLRAVGGVGPITALAYVLTLDDPDRFRKSREVAPSLGLVPKRDQSGSRDPQLRTPAPALQVQVSPRPATATCVACWSAAPNTSSDPSDPIVICAAGVSSSPNAEARTPRRERWWPWPASWLSSSTACG